MKIANMFLTLTLIIASSPASAQTVEKDIEKVSEETQKCLGNPDNYSTVGMNECLGQGYAAAEKILDSVYARLVADLKKSQDADSDKANAEILNRLVQSQEAWIKFRDADSDLQGTQMLGGSGESQIVLGTLYDMTKKRALQLNQVL